jgi:hypothetical protein
MRNTNIIFACSNQNQLQHDYGSNYAAAYRQTRRTIAILKYLFFRKVFLFWDSTPCSPLKVGTLLVTLSAWFLARLIRRQWRWKRRIYPKHRLTFNILHGVTSQKTELFITTAVRTSNPTSVVPFTVKLKEIRLLKCICKNVQSYCKKWNTVGNLE